MGQPPRLLSAGLLVALFFAASVSADACVTGCHGVRAGKTYEEGHTYTYDFEGTSVTSVSEAEGESSVKLNAVVELSVKPDCIRQVKLKDIRVNGAPISQKDVEQYALQFNYHDGHIDTNVCAEPNDSQVSLNIKRAIISLFQSSVMQENGFTTHRETDVFGNCETNFEFRKEGDKQVVRKHRDLSRCSHRESLRHGFIYSAYDDSSEIKTSPLIDSEQKTEQIFKKGILNSGKSTEVYVYKPFTNGRAEAKTVVQSNLVLKSNKPDASPPAPVSVSKSLVFDAPHPVTGSSADAITNALKQVKAASGPDGVKEGAAEKFGDFVKVLRRSNKNDILTVYRKVKSSPEMKILLDGLYRAGTGDAVEAAVELIKNKELDKYQTLGYLASFALADHVNLATVSAAASLLDHQNLPRIGYLSIGNVVGKYCRDHSCENVPEVQAALNKIVQKVGNGKPGSREAENVVIAALKGLGNARYLDDQTIDKIVGIAKDPAVHNRVRVAAIEALRTKCTMKWKTPLLDLFADREEDSEIRIKTYLSLVACPCAPVANRIKEIIDVETVNQVGSFVTTHLRNLRASADPSKAAAKRHFGEIKPRTKFPMDFRKFSFNNEHSYKVDALGIGSTVEHNVIYSQKSFVPRSASVNFTTEMFGRAFNFLEVDTRVENLDRLIEHYLGPKGVVKQSEISDLVHDGKKSFFDIYDHVNAHIERTKRGRRAAVNHGDVDKFAQTLKPRATEVDDDLDIDFSLKMFGIELAFLDLKEIKAGDHKSTVDKIFDFIDKALNKAKNFDYNLSNHIHFIDVDLVYPTGLGFPLSIGIEGNGVTNLKSNGKIDVPSILKDPKNAVIKIGFEPSASITVSTSVVIDTFGVESGLKVIGNLHTSTGGDLSLKILDGSGVDVSFGIPKKKQEIISVSSQVLYMDKNGAKKPLKFPKGKEHSDCFDQFSALLGVTICGQFSYPYESLDAIDKRPMFPVSGPAKFAVSVENNDATSYHFKVYYDKSKEHHRAVEVLFDTPNSRNNRKVLFRLEGVNEPTQKYIKAMFDSPFKTAEGQVLVDNNDKKKALTVSLKHDTDEYYGSIGIVANGNKYKPILEYKVPDHIERLAGGKGGKGDKATYKLDGDISVADQDGNKKYVFEKVSLYASGKKLASLDGSVTSGPRVLVVDTKLAHNEENLHVKLDGKRSDHGFDVNLAVVPSKDPNIGFQVVWHYDMTNEQIDHSFVLTYGADLQSKTNRFTFTDRLSYVKNADRASHPYVPLTALKSKSEVSWPAQNLEGKFEAEVSAKMFEIDFDFNYGKFKFGTDFEFEVKEGNPQNFEIGFESYIVDSKLALGFKHKKVSDHKRKIEGSLEVPGAKYELDATAVHHVEGQNINMGFDGKLRLNGKPLELSYGLETTPQKLNSHAFVSFENTKYLDFLMKGAKGTNPHGEFNLHIKKILIVAGQFTYQGGKGTATVNIDLPKFERKIKGTGDLTVTGSRHVANAELLLDAERDPSKRIKLSTDSDISKNAIDSKNTIEVFNYKVEANAKGKMVEKSKGSYSFDGNFDVLLPNGRYIVGNGKGSANRKPEKTEVQGQYELLDHVNKGGKARKVAYEYELAMDEPQKNKAHSKVKFEFSDFEGKNVVVNFGSKYEKPVDDGEGPRKADIDLSVSGGYLPRPFKFNWGTDFKTKKAGSWKLDSSLGDDLTVKGSGTQFNGYSENKPSTCEAVFEVKLPSEKLRNVKYQAKGSLLLPQENAGDVFELISSETLTYNDDKTISENMHFRLRGFQPGQKKEGLGKFTLAVLQHSPVTVATNWNYDPSKELKHGSGALSVKHGDKEVAVDFDATYAVDLTHVGLNVKAKTPAEKFRNVELGFERKLTKEGPWKYNAHIVADDKRYDVSSEFEINPNAYRVNVVLTCPAGKTEIFSKADKLGENEYSGEWKVTTPQGFATADGHVKFENIDDFIITFNFDSDKVKERKIHAEIASKPGAKTGKRILLTVTSDGKNLVTGSTNYSQRNEGGNVIIEGTGSLKVGENTRNSKFMYSRKQLTRENDGETGVAVLLNASFGPSAVVGELKLSDKEIHVFNSFCEQSKDCAHFKLQSILDTDRETRLHHQITVEVDLKKFYVPVEFGLKTTTKYHPKEPTLDHTANLYLHTAKDKTQYSSHVYANAKESGIILTVPTREFALISSVDVPKSKTPVGPYKIDISFYLDRKNRPNEKTSFTATGDVNVDKNSAAISGEARFTYPSQTKDILVKGKLHAGGDHIFDANVDIDVFAKKTQKITIATRILKNPVPKGYSVSSVVEVTSRGQQLKVELKENAIVTPNEIGFDSALSYNDKNQKPKTIGVTFNANNKRILLKIQGPNKMILDSESNMEFTKNVQKIETKHQILENPAVVTSIEVHDFNSFKYQSYQQDKSDNKLVVSGRTVIGQVMELHAEAFKGGEKKPLFSAAVYLDESRFLKPNFSYNKENVAALIDLYREKLVKYAEVLKNAIQEIAEEAATEFKDLFEHLKKAQPNWKPMLDYYEGELNKLAEELKSDKTLHEIIEAYNKVFGGFLTAVTQILKEFVQNLDKLHKQFNEIMEKVSEAIKSTWPRVKDSLDKILKAAVDVFDAASKLGATYLKAVLNIMNEHQKELKELATVLSDIAHDIVKIVMKGVNQVEGEVKNFVTLTIQQIRALPIYEMLQQKWAEISNYQVPEAILMPIEEAVVQLKKLLPTEELREFVTVTYNYIVKHIKHQKVDDGTEIKNIYVHAVDAIRSVIALLQDREFSKDLYDIFGENLYANFGYIKNLPGLPILKWSVINVIRNGELPTISDLYYAYRPTAYATDIVPPFSHTGIVVDGGHFFTFDGRHMTMAGTCDYVLAHDTRDGNFSVLASFNNGKLVSISLTAPSESITVKSNGNILVDNKPADYPASTKNLHAFLMLPVVNVKSDYGVRVACTQKAPMICSVHVSGFYHGRLRGLFGDANNEPYDDFTLPTGHVTENEGDFGNAYRLNPSCPAAPAVDHHSHTRSPTCTEFFGSSSSLSPCYNYVNPAPFRQACDHAVSANTPRGGCLITAAYYATCRKERVAVSIPASCVSCKVGKDIDVGDSFSVKIPNKEADIIFVIEQVDKNEKIFQELVTPLITEVKNEFKHHGINDVHIGLIGYADHMKWPQHYTTGGSTNINGEVKNMKFGASEPLVSFKEAKEGDLKTRLKFAKQRADVELGTFKLTDAYEEAIRYPFRPGAAKAVVAIIANPCEKSPLPLSLQQLRLLLGQKVYRDLGLTYYHIGYLNDILVSGKLQKNVVGYDAEVGYTFSDSKKKPLEGSIDKNNLVLTNNDVCAGFAISSGGAAFSSNNFLEGKPNQRKQFLQVTARKIVDDITNIELEEDCVCQQTFGLNVAARCKIVGRHEKEPRHSKGAVKAA